jgi:hypothetical protein
VGIERLEELQLLSASPLASTLASTVAAPLVTVQPVSNTAGGNTAAASGSRAAPLGQAVPAVTNSTPIGNTPAQIVHAYGFDQITFDNRTVAGNGAGQTIAIVDAYADPSISSHSIVDSPLDKPAATAGVVLSVTSGPAPRMDGSDMERYGLHSD